MQLYFSRVIPNTQMLTRFILLIWKNVSGFLVIPSKVVHNQYWGRETKMENTLLLFVCCSGSWWKSKQFWKSLPFVLIILHLLEEEKDKDPTDICSLLFRHMQLNYSSFFFFLLLSLWFLSASPVLSAVKKDWERKKGLGIASTFSCFFNYLKICYHRKKSGENSFQYFVSGMNLPLGWKGISPQLWIQ